MNVKAIKNFISSIIRSEPAILADWLEERFVPGIDEFWSREVLDSLRAGAVCVKVCGTGVPGSCFFPSWSNIKIRHLMVRLPSCEIAKPSHANSREKLYLRNRSGSVNWMFYWGQDLSHRTVNPLLFALAALAYGWSSLPKINWALNCIQPLPGDF